VGKKRFMDGDKNYNMSWFSPWSKKASEQGKVPILWMAQFSFWDQLNAMISAPPSPFIPLVLQTPLNNTVVIWTALIAYFYLHTRFRMVHYAGIVIILLSCFTGVVVELQGPPGIVCKGLDLANETLSSLSGVSDATKKQIEEASSNCISGLPPYKDSSGNDKTRQIQQLSALVVA